MELYSKVKKDFICGSSNEMYIFPVCRWPSRVPCVATPVFCLRRGWVMQSHKYLCICSRDPILMRSYYDSIHPNIIANWGDDYTLVKWSHPLPNPWLIWHHHHYSLCESLLSWCCCHNAALCRVETDNQVNVITSLQTRGEACLELLTMSLDVEIKHKCSTFNLK